MDRIAGNESGHHPKSPWGALLTAMLCTTCLVLFASEAGAQCSGRDVLRNHLTRKATPAAKSQLIMLKSAYAVPVWRTIKVGTFTNSFALLNALDLAGCSIGGWAEEILARPAFTVAARKTSVQLFAVSVAELGFQTAAPLSDIYARALQLGFGLAAAEVAPQLRLQYFDQPMGEFLIGMEPIKTWHGAPVILTVANGGAGLVLIGRDGSPGAEIPVAARFLFVLSDKATLANAVNEGLPTTPP